MPFAPIERAVTLHDAGWSLLDDDPRPLSDGRAPHVFDLPDGVSMPAWRRSVALARDVGRREALLVCGHFARFDGPFAEETAPLRAAWRQGVDPEWERQGIELVRVCDAISLRLLCDPEETVRLGQYRFEDGKLDPWPFRVDRIEDEVAGRVLPDRKWGDAKEFAEAYKTAPSEHFSVKLRPV